MEILDKSLTFENEPSAPTKRSEENSLPASVTTKTRCSSKFRLLTDSFSIILMSSIPANSE